MAFVLDCSETMAWLFSDEATKRGRIRAAEWLQIRGFLSALPIETDLVFLARTRGASLQLARAHPPSVHDAAYLELAVRLRMPLATLDRALQNVALPPGATRPELRYENRKTLVAHRLSTRCSQTYPQEGTQ